MFKNKKLMAFWIFVIFCIICLICKIITRDNFKVAEQLTTEGISTGKVETNIEDMVKESGLISEIKKHTMFEIDTDSSSIINLKKVYDSKYIIIQLDDGWKYEYHFFLGEQYLNSIYLQNQCGINPNVSIENFNEHILIRLDETIGKGTGLVEIDEVWYDFSINCIPEVFRFTKIYTYSNQKKIVNFNYTANVSKIQIDKNVLTVELSCLQNIENPLTGHQMFSIEKNMEYKLDDNNDDFIKEFQPKIDLKLRDDFNEMEFIENNYDKIAELLNSSDSEKKQWASKLVNNNQYEIDKLYALSNLARDSSVLN